MGTSDLVSTFLIQCGEVQTGSSGSIVGAGGIVCGNVQTANPGVVYAAGMVVGNIITASPAVVEGFGIFAGNIETVSPGLVEAYGIDVFNVFTFSPALIGDAEAITAFNYGIGDFTVAAGAGVDGYNGSVISPTLFDRSGRGPATPY
mmetsp:Transcript_21972/g.68385  ORF Transcript_21972/g.68385 Transcript_21972/m.68385 type:complete len:147 (-) Transcript_21972:293-733(-)